MTSTRVLLVDDVAGFRTLVATALRVRGGFEVIGEAADGAAAIAFATEQQPDVIVLDLGLPDIAGSEVIQLLRDRSPRSKIVVFSGRDEDEVSIRSVEGFVRKDDDVRRLVDVLVDITRERLLAGAVVRLPAELASAGRGRAFVRARCAEWGVDAILDDALLVASELVTNAVVHAGTDCELRLVPGLGMLRVEVLDHGSMAPDPQLAGDHEEHGRGLLLISMLSAAWGTEPSADGGKVVWADLPMAEVG
jgi:CheY-like chemotaxis protein